MIDENFLYDDYDDEPSEMEDEDFDGESENYKETDWNDRQLGVGGLFW